MIESKLVTSPIEANSHKLKNDGFESEPTDPTYYKTIIRSLRYLVNTRLDIYYATNTLSQFMCEPRKIHFMAAKHILRYLRGSVGMGLKYDQVEINLHGYLDSDWTSTLLIVRVP